MKQDFGNNEVSGVQPEHAAASSPVDPREGEWLSMSEASALTPYSAEYLSLLARKKKLTAKKVGKVWYTTSEILGEYMKRQMIRNQIQNGDFSPLAEKPPAPVAPVQKPTGEMIVFTKRPIQEPIVRGLTGSTPALTTAERALPESQPVRTFHGNFKKYLEKLKSIKGSEAAEPVISAVVPVVVPVAKPQAVGLDSIALTLDRISSRLEKIDVKAGQSNIVTRSFRTVFGSRPLIYSAIGLVVFFSIFPTPFVFGFFDGALSAAKKAWTDSNTVMGFRPGTHENEILLLDKQGNVSIMGHIETGGQFRSYAADGIAPIVVDSKTEVKNLNSESVGGNKPSDFTLAFVTKNGNVTTDDVFLDGAAEVGKALLVRGASHLLSSMTVDGNISVFGNAKFAKSLSVAGPAFFESLLNATNIKSTGVASLGEVITAGNVNIDRNARIRGSLEVGRALSAAGATFEYAGVAGDFSAGGAITLGNVKDEITINSKNLTLDESGNMSIQGNGRVTGSFTVSGNIVAGNIGLSGTLNAADLAVAGTATINSLVATSSVFGNSTTTNATSTSLFATLAHIAALAADSVSVDALTATNSTAVNSTTTNATSTNQFVANLVATSATVGSLAASGTLTANSVTSFGTSTAPVFDATSTTATSTFAGNVSVAGNLSFGTGIGNILAINSSIASNLIPDSNLTRNIGSPSYFWGTGYFDNINVNSISAASSSIAGTAANTFTINSDNVSVDGESMDLIFKRGSVTPNALLSWDSIAKRFAFNQPLYIQNASPSGNGITLDLQGNAGQTSSLFRVASSTGSDYLNLNNNGNLGIGTSSPSQLLSVQGNGLFSGNLTAANLTATGTLSGASFLATASSTLQNFTFLNATGTSATSTNFYAAAGRFTTGFIDTFTSTLSNITSLNVSGSFYNGSYNGPLQANNGLVSATTSVGVLYGGTGLTTAPSYGQLLFGNSSGGYALSATSSLGLLGSSTVASLSSSFIPKWTGSAFNNSVIYDNGTNVGIGTTTPSALLSVSPASGTTPFLISSSTGAQMLTVASNGNLGVGVISGNPLHRITLGANGPTTSYIAFEGNTATPYYAAGYNVTEDAFLIRANTGSTDVNMTQFELKRVSGNLGLGSTTPYAKLSVKGAGSTSGVNFQTTNSSDSPLFTILDSGNVGVGTTSPFTKLAVTAAGNSSLPLFLVSATGNYLTNAKIAQFNFDNDVRNVRIHQVGLAAYIDSNGASDLYLGPNDAGNVALQTNGTAKLTVLSGGNVGIGTTTPGANFVVNGTTGQNLIQVATSTNQAIFTINQNGNINLNQYNTASGGAVIDGYTMSIGRSGTTGGQTEGRININTPNQSFIDSVNSSQVRVAGFNGVRLAYGATPTTGLSLDSSGNVSIPVGVLTVTGSAASSIAGNLGIGTTTPSQRLSVQGDGLFSGDITAANIIATGTLSVSGAFTTSATSTASVFVATSASATSTFAGRAIVGASTYLNSAGSPVLGIVGNKGTTAAGLFTNQLSILDMTAGGAAGIGGAVSFDGDSSGGQRTTYSAISGYKENSTPTDYAGALAFYSRGGGGSLIERMRISSTGNVGIGTTTPGSKLTVVSADSLDGISLRSGGASNYTAYSIGRNQSGSAAGFRDGSWGVAGLANHFVTGTLAGDVIFGAEGGASRKLFLTTAINTGSNGIVIDSSGSVGIGTSSPQVRLEVAGTGENLRVSSDSTTHSSSIKIFTPGGLTNNNVLDFYNAGIQEWQFGMDNADSSKLKWQLGGGALSSTAQMTLTTSGNLGIGTTTPQYPLSVSASSNGFISANTGAGTFGGFRIQEDATDRWAISKNNTTDSLTFSRFNSTGVFQDDSLVISNSTGNVGIGTTTPPNKLYVGGGDIGLDPNQKIKFNYGGTSQYIGYRTTGIQTGIDIQGDTNGTATFGNSGLALGTYGGGGTAIPSNGLIVSGSVGIGTTTQASKLTVAGTVSVGTGTTPGSNQLTVFADVVDSGATGQLALRGLTSPRKGLFMGYDTTSDYGFINSGEEGVIYKPLAINDNGGNVYFLKASPSSIQTKVGVYQDASANNNLGGQFSVNGSTNTAQATTLGYDTTNNYGYIYSGINGSAWKPLVLHPMGGDNVLIGGTTNISGTGGLKVYGTTDATSLSVAALQTLGGAAITKNLLVGGNVGIGTTSPSNPLSVNGNSYLNGRLGVGVNPTASGDSSLVQVYSNTGASFATFKQTDTNGSSIAIKPGNGSNNSHITSNYVTGNGYFGFGAGGTDDQMVITNGGSVGIGTTNPVGGKLSVNGVIHGYGGNGGYGEINLSNNEANSTGRFQIRADSSDSITGWKFKDVDGFPLVFGTTNTPRMTIAAGGNVGIGTTTPTNKLTVNGIAKFGDLSAVIAQTGGIIALGDDYTSVTNVGIYRGTLAGAYNGGNTLNLGGYDNVNILASATTLGNQTVRMTVLGSNGNVGIGTTTPRGALHVNAASGDAELYITTQDTGNSIQRVRFNNNAGNTASFGLMASGGTSWPANSTVVDYSASGPLVFTEATTERMRIANGGNMMIGTTTPDPTGSGSSGKLVIQTLNGGQAALTAYNQGTGPVNIISLENGNGQVGRIQVSGSATSYLTSSDRRLKENIVATALGIETLRQIPVVDYDFIKNPSHRTQGFIAQDLYNYYPDAVAVGGEDVNKNSWAVDYGRLTPLIVRSIQQLDGEVSSTTAAVMAMNLSVAGLSGRIDSVEVRLAALESGTASSTQSITWSSDFGVQMLSFLETAGLKLQNGIAYIQNAVVNSLTANIAYIKDATIDSASVGALTIGSAEKRTGITLYDELTGSPYCLKIAGGQTITAQGACGTAASASSTPQAPVQGGISGVVGQPAPGSTIVAPVAGVVSTGESTTMITGVTSSSTPIVAISTSTVATSTDLVVPVAAVIATSTPISMATSTAVSTATSTATSTTP